MDRRDSHLLKLNTLFKGILEDPMRMMALKMDRRDSHLLKLKRVFKGILEDPMRMTAQDPLPKSY